MPNRKLIAGPTWFAVYTTAVAVALCLSGNHATDNLLYRIGQIVVVRLCGVGGGEGEGFLLGGGANERTCRGIEYLSYMEEYSGVCMAPVQCGMFSGKRR